MNPHTATARHVHDVLVAAGVPQVHPVPVPTVPVLAGAVIVGSPQLPQQATSTGCAPAEMIATVTVVAGGATQPAIEQLYERTDLVLDALLEAGGWMPSTTPATWDGQDTLPLPAITITISIGYPQE